MKTTNLPVSKDVRNFILNLLEEAGMDLVPESVKEYMLADLAKRLDGKLTMAALKFLPASKIEEFEGLLDGNKSVLEIADYLEKNIPNVNAVYSQALIEFRNSYLS